MLNSKTYNRAYYLENRNRLLTQKKLSRERCKKQRSDYNVKYRIALKEEVLKRYNPEGVLACSVCGESRLACLTLDHINNDGHREKKRGFNFYLWLKKNDYPYSDLQTLCMNCQYIKRQEFYEEQRQRRINKI